MATKNRHSPEGTSRRVLPSREDRRLSLGLDPCSRTDDLPVGRIPLAKFPLPESSEELPTLGCARIPSDLKWEGPGNTQRRSVFAI